MIKHLFFRATTIEAVLLLVIGTLFGIALFILFGETKLDPTVSSVLGAFIGVCGAAGVAIWVFESRHKRDRKHTAIYNLSAFAGIDVGLQSLMKLINPNCGASMDDISQSLAGVVTHMKEVIELDPPDPILGWEAVIAVRKAKSRISKFLDRDEDDRILFVCAPDAVIILWKDVNAANKLLISIGMSVNSSQQHFV